MEMSDFGSAADALRNLLNPEICVCHAQWEDFSIDETASDGRGQVNLSSKYPCIHVMRMDKHVFPVLKNQKCADHLVLLHDPERNAWSLHIFELTKTVSNSRWQDKILPQFSGGLANAWAISGVLRLPRFSAVTAHCCYRFDGNRTSPVEMRTETGKKAKDNWTEGTTIRLEEFPGLSIHKSLLRLDEESGKLDLEQPLDFIGVGNRNEREGA